MIMVKQSMRFNLQYRDSDEKEHDDAPQDGEEKKEKKKAKPTEQPVNFDDL